LKTRREFSNTKETPANFYKTLLDNLLEGVQVISFDWKYHYVNNALVDQSHRSRDQLIGFTMMEVYPGIEHSPLFKQLESSMKNRQVNRFENQFQFDDGTSGYFELIIEPVDEGILILSMDITDRVLRKNESELLKSKLEEQVAQRTIELKQAIYELESFSYSVSHDLRSPLRAISGYSEILKQEWKTLDDEDRTRMLSFLISNTNQMGNLIDDLLKLSQVARKPLVKVYFSMNEMIKTCIETLNLVYSPKTQFTYQNLPDAYGDPRLVQQVVLNLISNAIKFSKSRQIPKINIHGKQTDKEIEISVQDNGIGFDSNYKEKLFQAFQRLHDSSVYEGTGIGLTIVKRIVERHGGKVWADSELNKGAVFTFTLPKTL